MFPDNADLAAGVSRLFVTLEEALGIFLPTPRVSGRRLAFAGGLPHKAGGLGGGTSVAI